MYLRQRKHDFHAKSSLDLEMSIETRIGDPIVVFDAVIHLWLECRPRSLWVYPQVGGTLILVKTTV